MKKLLCLGASHFQIPAIQYAKSQGHHVITCDYLPSNPGHAFSDETFEISTTDKDAILTLSKQLKIDGVLAYASDPAAPTAAYVGNALNLPSNPYESVLTLTNKHLFRSFMQKNNLLTPRFTSSNQYDDICAFIDSTHGYCIIKPADSSGSKGVSRVSNHEDCKLAFERALSFSKENQVIIEEFIDVNGHQIAGDGFIVDGQLIFTSLANEHFNSNGNGLVPIGESFPCSHSINEKQALTRILQTIISRLGLTIGPINIDARINSKGQIYVLEIGPRNGGNWIPEVIFQLTGVDLIKYSVDASLGLPLPSEFSKETNGYYASYILHSNESGYFKDLQVSDNLLPYIVRKDLFISKGEPVSAFDGSHCTIGAMILTFSNQEEMHTMMKNMNDFYRVILE